MKREVFRVIMILIAAGIIGAMLILGIPIHK